jgi:hypothetical protein
MTPALKKAVLDPASKMHSRRLDVTVEVSMRINQAPKKLPASGLDRIK